MGCLCMGFSRILTLKSPKYIYIYLSLLQINSRSRSNAWWNFTIHMQGSNCVSFYGYKHIQWVHCCCWDFSLQGNGCDIFLISIILFIWDIYVAIIIFDKIIAFKLTADSISHFCIEIALYKPVRPLLWFYCFCVI